MSHNLNKTFLIAGLIIGLLTQVNQASGLEQQVLPNTDGYGLLAKPVRFTEQQRSLQYRQGVDSCDANCVTPFGQELGIADGIAGYSNCQSVCINPKYSFLNLSDKSVSLQAKSPNDDNRHYIGLINQCVEYARRWWMINSDITFGDIDSAHEIIYLTQGKNIYSGQHFEMARSINGSAKRPPQRGDLLIYYPDKENPMWRHGHVAVIIAVDLDKGIVSVAEQNYNNQPWANPKHYSRQIKLFAVGGRYHVIDVSPVSNKNPGGGKISGWIYPVIQ